MSGFVAHELSAFGNPVGEVDRQTLSDMLRIDLIRKGSDYGCHNINDDDLKSSIFAHMRAVGLKLTSQRIATITVLVNDKSHPSALTIHRKVREQVPSLSLSTVYHFLNLLKKHNLIKELEFAGIENRYEADTRCHLNLVCSKCGKIEDFTLNLPISIETIHQEVGFKTIETRLEYYGICKTCSTSS